MAISQLMLGAVRMAVALMVMAAEIDVSMSVRVFEELTQTQPQPNGLVTVQMRSGLHLLNGHSGKKKPWQRSYFYVKADSAAFEDPPDESFRVLWNCDIVAHPTTFKSPEPFWIDVPKIAVLTEQQWESFNQQRIDRQRERIAKGDWTSTVPCEETKGKRLKLPLMGVIPKAYSSYSAMLRAQLGGGSYESMLASEGQEVEIRGSPSVKKTIDDGDTEVQGPLAEDTGVAVSDPLMGESSEQTKKKKRRKKKDKSLNEVTTDPGDGGGLAEGEPVVDDQSVNRTMDPKDSAEEGRADTSIAKRKEAPSGGSLSSGGKKLKESGDSFSRSA
ncbi:hypothetical protein Bca4012_065570 [Brassica carinata]